MAGTYLALLGPSLSLQGAGAALHTLGEAEVAVVGAVVEVGQPRQGQDVVTGDPQDGQFGQLLPIGVTRHLGVEKASGGAAGGSVLSAAQQGTLARQTGPLTMMSRCPKVDRRAAEGARLIP